MSALPEGAWVAPARVYAFSILLTWLIGGAFLASAVISLRRQALAL